MTSFVLIIILAVFGLWQWNLCQKLPKALQIALWILFGYKMLTALTMGHYDIYRFIVFFQHFVALPAQNPYRFDLITPAADFPYPPLLMYLHAAFFAPFRSVLNLADPYTPTALGYVLIRIPFLIADFSIVSFLIGMYRDTKKWQALGFYLFSSVILFHQYYSGQLDLIAAAPFVYAIFFLKKEDFSLRVMLLLALSLAFKPFGLLFFPLLLGEALRTKNWLNAFGILVGAVALYEFSQLPYYFTASYKEVVGASSTYLLAPPPWIHTGIFPAMFIVISGLFILNAIYRWRDWSISEAIVMVTLAIAAGAPHSAGWMVWAIPFGAIAMFEEEKSVIKNWLWWIWSALFVIKWGLVIQGPLVDSWGVFTNVFLHYNYYLPMGWPYLELTGRYGVDVADAAYHAADVSFSLMSLLLLLTIAWKIWAYRPNLATAKG